MRRALSAIDSARRFVERSACRWADLPGHTSASAAAADSWNQLRERSYWPDADLRARVPARVAPPGAYVRVFIFRVFLAGAQPVGGGAHGGGGVRHTPSAGV